MNMMINASKLDFKLIRYYSKSICFTICVPLVFILAYRSLLTGISFAMFFMAMSSIYTFTVAEKNDMHRYYGMLPISAAELVCGKYLHIFLLGLLSLIVSGTLQPLILMSLGVEISFSEIIKASLLGIVLFCTYISFQLPGYYKYGAIKGRIFMYIPVAGVILTMFVLEKVNISTAPILQLFSRNSYMVPGLALIYMVSITTISMMISINIVKSKEW